MKPKMKQRPSHRRTQEGVNPYRQIEFFVCNEQFAVRNVQTNSILALCHTLQEAMSYRDSHPVSIQRDIMKGQLTAA